MVVITLRVMIANKDRTVVFVIEPRRLAVVDYW